MSDPSPNPMDGPEASTPAQGGAMPQEVNKPSPFVEDDAGQASTGGGELTEKEETEEEILQRLAGGKFLLDPDGLAQIYAKYYEAFDGLLRVRPEELYWDGETSQYPGMLIRGIAKVEQRCQAEATALSNRVTTVGNDLSKLLAGLAETAEKTYQTDAEGSDATKATQADS